MIEGVEPSAFPDADLGEKVGPKPCARRIDVRAWCTRPDAHDGACYGPTLIIPEPQTFMPRKR